MSLRTLEVPAALDLDCVQAMHAALQRAVADGGISGLLLAGGKVPAGARRVFCAGLDLQQVVRGANARALADALAKLLLAVRLAPVPTAAAVAGEAKGGGVGLAAACDVVVAAVDVEFALPELLFGLTPAIILPLLAERVAPQRLRLRALAGGAWPAAAALADGLVDRVVPADAVDAAARAALRTLRRPRRAMVAAWKALTAESAQLAAGLARGAQLTANALDDDDTRRRLDAFHREGAPPWL
jgi:enoyl-CoA hydratase/carnithine racemase